MTFACLLGLCPLPAKHALHLLLFAGRVQLLEVSHDSPRSPSQSQHTAQPWPRLMLVAVLFQMKREEPAVSSKRRANRC